MSKDEGVRLLIKQSLFMIRLKVIDLKTSVVKPVIIPVKVIV